MPHLYTYCPECCLPCPLLHPFSSPFKSAQPAKVDIDVLATTVYGKASLSIPGRSVSEALLIKDVQ